MALHALAPALTGHVLVQAIGVRDDGWDANSRKGARGHETSAPEDRGIMQGIMMFCRAHRSGQQYLRQSLISELGGVSLPRPTDHVGRLYGSDMCVECEVCARRTSTRIGVFRVPVPPRPADPLPFPAPKTLSLPDAHIHNIHPSASRAAMFPPCQSPYRFLSMRRAASRGSGRCTRAPFSHSVRPW